VRGFSRNELTATSRPVGERFGGNGLALFDLDRTLVPGSSLVHLGRALARHGLLRRRQLAAGLVRNAAFKRRGAPDDSADRLRSGLLALAGGVERQVLLDVVGEVTPDIIGAVYPAARWLLSGHLRAGDFCVIVSASPQELVEAVAGALGAHRAVGTVARVVDGRYTGELDGSFCYGRGKLTRLRTELGELNGVRSVAYADSASDLPLLRSSDQPVAVNPDRRLLAVSRESGWPVLRFVA
jgi:HAD superfamily hydrolase (TIGR01490 family)